LDKVNPMEKKLTLNQAIQIVLADLNKPFTEDELAKRVFEIYPTTAKTAKSSLKNVIHYELDGKTLIRLNKDRLIPMQTFMPGIRFRIPVSGQEVKEGCLPTEAFEPFLFRHSEKGELQLLDEDGTALPVRIKSVKVAQPKGLALLIGATTGEVFALQDWFKKWKIRSGDSILVTIQDWERHVFTLEHEPAGKRQPAPIQAANREFADVLFSILEESYDDKPVAFQIIPKVYAMLSNPYGYPGDAWTQVIEQDGRMNYNDWMITYAEEISLWDRFVVDDDEHLPYIRDTYTPAQSKQVIRLKAEAGFDKKIWRTIEIKSSQTLTDLDHILRAAFQHDTGDHLGGFWKLIPRGSTKRTREVEIGDINPFEGGSAADIHVGGLALKPGDRMKYVFDFGDWLEHFLTVEQISSIETGVKYPRISAQNKPRYRDCQDCAAAGRKTAATILCLPCSGRQRKDVLLCKECFTKKHADHDGAEILY
jgi:hypothetical protein